MEKLLGCLADGGFHSYESLYDALGMGQLVIIEKLKLLESFGLQIETVPSKGCRLETSIELLDKAHICKLLHSATKDTIDLHIYLEAISTNDLVRELPSISPLHKTVCLAEYQTNGRGRRGKAWSSPLGTGISMSIRWFYDAARVSLDGLSLVVGLAILKALQNNGANNLKLKWPNDILWDSSREFLKVGGVLLEIYGDPRKDCEVVIGVGINMAMSGQQLSDINGSAVDMQRVCHAAMSRNGTTSALINEVCRTLDIFSQYGFSYFRKEWERYDAFIGQDVVLDKSGQSVSGVSLGVDNCGGLLLKTQLGTIVFNGGEVSLKAGISEYEG